MYGLVNKALADLVCTSFGADAWETIKQHAGVEVNIGLHTEKGLAMSPAMASKVACSC